MKNSPAYSFIKEHVENEFTAFNKEKITPWAFFKNESGIEITAFDGSKIRYKGIEFEGSPKLIFWGNFTQPFLKDIISRTFAKTREFCQKYKLNAEKPLKETTLLLTDHVHSMFERMVDIDRRLRGKGHPESVAAHDPGKELGVITSFLNERYQAELSLLPKKNILNKFYEEQKFWVWLIGIALTFIGIIIKIIG